MYTVGGCDQQHTFQPITRALDGELEKALEDVNQVLAEPEDAPVSPPPTAELPPYIQALIEQASKGHIAIITKDDSQAFHALRARSYPVVVRCGPMQGDWTLKRLEEQHGSMTVTVRVDTGNGKKPVEKVGQLAQFLKDFKDPKGKVFQLRV